MAQIIHLKCNAVTLEPALNLVETMKIEDQWIQHFLHHHPELSSVRLRRMEIGRVKDTSYERLSKWFVDLQSAVTEYDILPENLYNMDQSSFAIGEVEGSVTIINVEVQSHLQKANPGHQEWVTSVECICLLEM